MSDNSLLTGLPIPPKEKVGRWVAHAGILALGVTCILTFMPYINKALALLLTGFWSITQLGLLAAGVCLGVYAFINLWPIYKKLVESLSNKATWVLFEFDPITPVQMYLNEFHENANALRNQFLQVNGIIQQNETAIQNTQTAIGKADKLYAQAVSQYGAGTPKANLASLEPGVKRDQIERLKNITKPLYAIRDILKNVLDATEFTERKAELDFEGLKQEFGMAQTTDSAINAASRALGKTQRKADAMQAMQIIHDKYANSFGRLQGLQQLSQELITSVDLQKGTYQQEALERLRTESNLITGTQHTTEVLQAVPNGQDNGISLYTVPNTNSSNRASH